MLLAGCVAALVLGASPGGRADLPKLMILDVAANQGVEAAVASALTDAVIAHSSRSGLFKIVSSRDVGTLLKFDRQKQLLGCNEERCFAEIAGALGVQFLLSGTLSRVGSTYQLTMQTISATNATPIGRTARLAKSPEVLLEDLPYAVAEATGQPLPRPPPVRPLPYIVTGAGGLALVTGGLIALKAFSDESALRRELDRGLESPNDLRSLSTYREESSAIGTTKLVAAISAGLGAAALGAGLYLLFAPDADAKPLTIAPTANGVVATGVFP